MTPPVLPDGFDDVLIVPIDHSSSLTLSVLPGNAPRNSPEADQAWKQLCAQNPALFNGRILALEAWHPQSHQLVARIAQYRHMVVPEVGHQRIVQIGVTGVLVAHGPSGNAQEPNILLAKRTTRTTVYPGLWELAPSGGIEPPESAPATLQIDAWFETLFRESAEELGLDVTGCNPTTPMLCFDPFAPSADLVCVVHLSESCNTIEPRVLAHLARSWEYTAVRWIPVCSLAMESDDMQNQIIPPTRAILRALSRDQSLITR